jgi:hypothetical protein
MLSSISTHLRLRMVLTILGVGAFCTGCPDPDGSFDDFVVRYGQTHKPGPPAACGETVTEIEGDFLFALSASISAEKPLLFAAKLSMEAGGVKFNVQPLAIDRKTLVGMPIDIGPFPIDDKGKLVADLPELTVPGEANPITKCAKPPMCDTSVIVADTALDGAVCKDFICGDVTGATSKPLKLQLKDSTFTLERLDKPGEYPEPPQINCAGALAKPVSEI